MKNLYYLIILILFSFFLQNINAQQTVGLFLNDANSFDGYTLFAPRKSKTTYLIDNNGMLVHSWQHPYGPGHGVYLLGNGNLLRSSTIPDSNGGNGGFQEIDWDGNIVREYIKGAQHHDIEYLPNGNVLLILNDTRTKAEAIAAGRDPSLVGNKLRSLRIVEINPDSSVVWEWQLWDHLIQDFDPASTNYGIVENHPELMDINFAESSNANWTHTNSISYNSSLDQILISNRALNEIWIIDHSTTTQQAASHSGGNSGKGGDFLFRWGNPASYRSGTTSDQKLFGQHDVHWIKSGLNGEGNILIFNNGLGRPDGDYSTIDEIVPPVDGLGNYSMIGDSVFGPDTLAWRFKATPDTSFFDSRISGSQRLPNGNTLICSGVGGRFFEVTTLGDIVWEYINPVENGVAISQETVVVDNDVARCYRYSAGYPGLVGKDLTPIGTIELPPVAVKFIDDSLPTEFTIRNYPNPFNPSTTINFTIPKSGEYKLEVFNSLGSKVSELINKHLSKGNYSTNFNAKGSSSGIYFYRLTGNNISVSKKMLLLK